jgi:hypothetical protein
MKHVVWKAYWDYEKEEKWLNEMSAKGMALTDYSWCRYVFTEAPNNEYIYRLELLEHLPSHAESVAYIRFLEESGIEHVATYWRWIFLRKKSSEGPFDIYSDIGSKIKQYRRVSTLFGAIGGINLFAFLVNIINGIAESSKYNNNYLSYVSPLVLLNGVFGVCLTWLVIGYIRKISKLKKEKQLHE